jgi:hypothetical protein
MPINTRKNTAPFTKRIAAVTSVALLGASVALVASAPAAHAQEPAAPVKGTVIDGLDYGPLAQFIGTWKSVDSVGVDVAPGQTGSRVGKDGRAVSPFYETITFAPALGVTNDSVQNLVAVAYHEAVFRRWNNRQFHDQIGYLIYDKQRQTVYNTFCLPRGVCVVAEGKPGNKMTLTAMSKGIAESQFMLKNDKTIGFSITYDVFGNTLKFTEKTDLFVYGKPFSHVDSDALRKMN